MSFEIVEDTLKTNEKYALCRRNVCFKLGTIPTNTVDPEEWLKDGVRKIVEHIMKNVNGEDKIGFTFSSSCLASEEMHLPFRKASAVTFEDVWNLLGAIYQSNSEGVHSDTFRIIMTQAKGFRGGGRHKRWYNNFREDCQMRRGIIYIDNRDSLCLARALVVALAYVMNMPYRVQIRKNTKKLQDRETQKLLSESGIIIPSEGSGVDELKRFQQHFKDFKITVYNYNKKGRDVMFEGPSAPRNLNLIHHKGHFCVITSLTAAFACSYYCELCHVPYNNTDNHRCQGKCPCCQKSPPCERTRHEISCSICNRNFRGPSCYDNHKLPKLKSKTTTCQSVRRCAECLKTVKTDRVHNCGEIYCKMCKKHRPAGHYCYIQPDSREPITENILFVFYDLETQQDTEGPNGDKIHIPNLCVFQYRCSLCVEGTNCEKCFGSVKVIQHEPIARFMEFLLSMRQIYKRVVVTAHCGGGFDHHFLLKHVLEETDFMPKLILRGTRIIMMTIENLKFIDSLNYFPLPLSKLTEAFDLGSNFKKGYFPHLFNTKANEHYVGSIPSIEFFTPHSMKEDERAVFLQWYKNHSENDVFDLKKELIAYCINDVDILTKACLKFREMFLTECKVCPFSEATTIASACSLVYRRNFLEPDTIGIIPRGGYRGKGTQSKIATRWLLWEEQKRGINIMCSVKTREALVEGVKVDGYCEETKQVFEFHGCYFHGCPSCFMTNRDSPLHEDPSDCLNTRYERTVKKTSRLQQRGYEVIEIWHCEFRKQMEADKKIKEATDNHPLLKTGHLDPRDSFYGGRTGNCKTYYQCKPNEKIKYVDVCSLYPWVCKFGKFPIGHPTVYVGEECYTLDIQKTEGLIKCKVLPPTKLFHPVLPIRMAEKLMFLLCYTCGKNMNSDQCEHTVEQRAITGTWVIDEVNKALEKGYIILEIYEVWQYKVRQQNKLSHIDGIFTSMMDTFIKLKQQSSGFPKNCSSDEEKNAYIEEFFEKEGIRMEFSDILNNPGLRSLAKLMLNSFWGKFGQRDNQTKTVIVRQSSEYLEYLNNPALEIEQIIEVTDEALIISYVHREEAVDLQSTVNVCIAAYTTAQARLKLYSYLEKLEERVLYYDTDSVIYIYRENEYNVPTGNCLGEMTDELEGYGDNSYILVFAAGGPKNYSYLVFSPEYNTYFTLCKVKGFRLDYDTLKQLNFYSMCQMVSTEEPEESLHLKSLGIRRTKKHQIVSREETKIYRPRSEKRFFLKHNSVPYGYKKSE